jgi:hypothetical protein
MLPVFPKPTISRGQKNAALVVAGIVDLIQMPGFFVFGWGAASVFQDALDIITAFLLVAICGFKWQFVAAFAAELVPGLTLFPTWTMVVLTLQTHDRPAADPATRVSASRVDRQAAPGRGPIDVQATVVPPVQAPPMRG